AGLEITGLVAVVILLIINTLMELFEILREFRKFNLHAYFANLFNWIDILSIMCMWATIFSWGVYVILAASFGTKQSSWVYVIHAASFGMEQSYPILADPNAKARHFETDPASEKDFLLLIADFVLLISDVRALSHAMTFGRDVAVARAMTFHQSSEREQIDVKALSHAMTVYSTFAGISVVCFVLRMLKSGIIRSSSSSSFSTSDPIPSRGWCL
ncbi:hypothetical protein T484DRAFT_1778914, partial [Baffinella frigidus]